MVVLFEKNLHPFKKNWIPLLHLVIIIMKKGEEERDENGNVRDKDGGDVMTSSFLGETIDWCESSALDSFLIVLECQSASR